jgi:hypothetical protein
MHKQIIRLFGFVVSKKLSSLNQKYGGGVLVLYIQQQQFGAQLFKQPLSNFAGKPS